MSESRTVTWNFSPLLPFDDLDIAVVDVFEAEKLASQADWLFSIWSRGGPLVTRHLKSWTPPDWVANHPNAHVFEFDDTCGETGPSEADVRRIIEVAPLLGGRVLVHCMAGVSRSAATALTLLATRMGSGRVRDTVQALLLARQRTAERGWRSTGFSPNRRLVKFADTLLSCNGELHGVLSDASWYHVEEDEDDPHFG